jgi:hypothetical protein
VSTSLPIFWRAVRHFWLTRQNQADEQVVRGVQDQGTRGSATGGSHLDGFHYILSEQLIDAGVPAESIFAGRGKLVLPGHFRPAKQWDLLVVHARELIAAIELKSQVGSLGNNANNRFEEAIGNAVDFARAYETGVLVASEMPWVGYLFLLSPVAEASRPVKTSAPHFPVRPEHFNASYSQRLGTICAMMKQEGLYHATCPMLADQSERDSVPNYVEPRADLTGERFVTEMVAGVTDRMRRRGAI